MDSLFCCCCCVFVFVLFCFPVMKETYNNSVIGRKEHLRTFNKALMFLCYLRYQMTNILASENICTTLWEQHWNSWFPETKINNMKVSGRAGKWIQPSEDLIICLSNETIIFSNDLFLCSNATVVLWMAIML